MILNCMDTHTAALVCGTLPQGASWSKVKTPQGKGCSPPQEVDARQSTLSTAVKIDSLEMESLLGQKLHASWTSVSVSGPKLLTGFGLALTFGRSNSLLPCHWCLRHSETGWLVVLGSLICFISMSVMFKACHFDVLTFHMHFQIFTPLLVCPYPPLVHAGV